MMCIYKFSTSYENIIICIADNVGTAWEKVEQFLGENESPYDIVPEYIIDVVETITLKDVYYETDTIDAKLELVPVEC